MRGNVKFIGNLLKIVTIAVMFMLAVTMKSYAADSTNGLSYDNIEKFFEDIPTESSGTGSAQEGDNQGTNNQENSNQNADAQTPKTTSSSSNSSNKIPATGSNVEIIFAAGTIVLVGGAIFVYKKQSIKIK